MKNILKKITNKSVIITVIGLGYVGLPLIHRFVKKKIKTYGIDIDKKKVNYLINGKNYIKSINIDYFKKNKNRVFSNYNIVSKSDIIIICLPTPLKRNKPDLSYIKKCMKNIFPYLKEGQMLVLESTVYPGATNEILTSKLKQKFTIGQNFFIGYSPERENPGDKHFSYQKTPKVVSGYTKKCSLIIQKFYKIISKKVYLSPSITVAETSKLLENLYRAVNIGLINEFKIICKKLNIDVFDVIDAASTKNFGFQKFMPGPGWGGHCIPIDPFYLSWISRKKGYDPKLISVSGKINTLISKRIVNEIILFIKKKYSNKKKIKLLIIGLSYKKNVDDDRESPSYAFFKILNYKKIFFDYYDPYFPQTVLGRVNKIKKTCIKFNSKTIGKYDASIIITDHDKIDYKKLYKSSKLIFDTRGGMKKFQKHDKNKKIIFV